MIRAKSGYGRASKNDFDVIAEVGPTFFEQMDSVRQWHLGFEEYYDVYIWDANPGRHYTTLQRKLEEVNITTRKLRILLTSFADTCSRNTSQERQGYVQRMRPDIQDDHERPGYRKGTIHWARRMCGEHVGQPRP